MTAVAFTIYGTAAPAGSKKGFVNHKTGRVIVTDDSKRSRPWKAEVTAAAIDAMTRWDGRIAPPLDGPLLLEVTFFVARPKGHYGTGRNADRVKPGAPSHPTVKPDLLKLARAVEDALTGTVYRDDAQITCEVLQKAYTTGQPRTEVRVRVVPVEEPAEAELARHSKGRSRGLFTSGDDHPATQRRGEKHWQARLTDDQVSEIRRRRAMGDTTVALGREFGVHPSTISRIARSEWRKEVSR